MKRHEYTSRKSLTYIVNLWSNLLIVVGLVKLTVLRSMSKPLDEVRVLHKKIPY